MPMYYAQQQQQRMPLSLAAYKAKRMPSPPSSSNKQQQQQQQQQQPLLDIEALEKEGKEVRIKRVHHVQRRALEPVTVDQVPDVLDDLFPKEILARQSLNTTYAHPPPPQPQHHYPHNQSIMHEKCNCSDCNPHMYHNHHCTCNDCTFMRHQATIKARHQTHSFYSPYHTNNHNYSPKPMCTCDDCMERNSFSSHYHHTPHQRISRAFNPAEYEDWSNNVNNNRRKSWYDK